MGRGDKAFDYYTRIAPAYTEEYSEIHRLEPYVYAQMVAGKDAKRFGEAKNSWLTGTASWNFIAISQYILGGGASVPRRHNENQCCKSRSCIERSEGDCR